METPRFHLSLKFRGGLKTGEFDTRHPFRILTVDEFSHGRPFLPNGRLCEKSPAKACLLGGFFLCAMCFFDFIAQKYPVGSIHFFLRWLVQPSPDCFQKTSGSWDREGYCDRRLPSKAKPWKPRRVLNLTLFFNASGRTKKGFNRASGHFSFQQ